MGSDFWFWILILLCLCYSNVMASVLVLLNTSKLKDEKLPSRVSMVVGIFQKKGIILSFNWKAYQKVQQTKGMYTSVLFIFQLFWVLNVDHYISHHYQSGSACGDIFHADLCGAAQWSIYPKSSMKKKTNKEVQNVSQYQRVQSIRILMCFLWQQHFEQ